MSKEEGKYRRRGAGNKYILFGKFGRRIPPSFDRIIIIIQSRLLRILELNNCLESLWPNSPCTKESLPALPGRHSCPLCWLCPMCRWTTCPLSTSERERPTSLELVKPSILAPQVMYGVVPCYTAMLGYQAVRPALCLYC